jgi:hypothetical protein
MRRYGTLWDNSQITLNSVGVFMHHLTIKKDTFLRARKGRYWEALQFIGLETSGISSMYKPLLFGGNASLQLEGKPFSGRKNLIINHGGLRNKEASDRLKRLFKQEIKPTLIEYLPGIEKGFNGKIELHFGGGVLQRAVIMTN